jgi:FKBP-type peptidyl-prolyl cis-trans isomerase 2
MQPAKLGDRVRVQYARVRQAAAEPTTPVRPTKSLKLSKTPKKAADPAVAKPPALKEVEFTVGGDEVMSGLSHGVVGMAPGEQKRFTLQPAEAYGPVKPALIKEIPRHQFPKRLVLRVGKRLSALSTLSGQRRQVRVVEIKTGTIVVDGNHMLAGKVVEFEVQMLAIDRSSANVGGPERSATAQVAAAPPS